MSISRAHAILSRPDKQEKLTTYRREKDGRPHVIRQGWLWFVLRVLGVAGIYLQGIISILTSTGTKLLSGIFSSSRQHCSITSLFCSLPYYERSVQYSVRTYANSVSNCRRRHAPPVQSRVLFVRHHLKLATHNPHTNTACTMLFSFFFLLKLLTL